MTDSTTENKVVEDPLESGPSAEEWFGDIEDESLNDNSLNGESVESMSVETESTESKSTEALSVVHDETATESESIEDTTAADVFNQLHEQNDGSGTEPDFLEANPEELIEIVDTSEERTESVDEDLFSEADLDSLLLSERREGDEFLWVETEAETGAETHDTASPEETIGTAVEFVDSSAEPTVSADNSVEPSESTSAGTGTTEAGTDELSAGYGDDTGESSASSGQSTNSSESTGQTPGTDETERSSTDDSQLADSSIDSSTQATDSTTADGPSSVEDQEETSPEADPEPISRETSTVSEKADGSSGDTNTPPAPEQTLPVPAPTDDEETGGILSWIRTKIRRLF